MAEKKALRAGFKDALPIIMGYVPIGIAYGMLAVQNGLDGYTTVAMSLFVFAGSSQLITVEMVGKGAAVLAIILMTFLVNLRHLLMSASLSLHFQKTDSRLLPLLSFFITDESFAVGSTGIEDHNNKAHYFLGLGVSAYLGWVISSWVGVALQTILPVIESAALDFVLPAMFIVLLVLQIQDRRDVIIAVVAGTVSILLIYLLPGNWNVILATIIAATAGVVVERWKPDIL